MTDHRAPPQTSSVGDRAELQAIYRAHFGYVWNSLRRLGVVERDREDLAHDVFVVVHRQLPSFDRTRPIKPWLFGITYRVALDHQRKASTHREILEVPDEPVDADWASILDRLEQRDLQKLALAALESLDLDRRAVLVLHEIEERPAPEIAELMSVPVNTVYSRLRLARQGFARAVERIRAQEVRREGA